MGGGASFFDRSCVCYFKLLAKQERGFRRQELGDTCETSKVNVTSEIKLKCTKKSPPNSLQMITNEASVRFWWCYGGGF